MVAMHVRPTPKNVCICLIIEFGRMLHVLSNVGKSPTKKQRITDGLCQGNLLYIVYRVLHELIIILYTTDILPPIEGKAV